MLIIRIIVVVINSFDSCVKSENRKLSRDWAAESSVNIIGDWTREARVRTEQRAEAGSRVSRDPGPRRNSARPESGDNIW